MFVHQDLLKTITKQTKGTLQPKVIVEFFKFTVFIIIIDVYKSK